MNSGWRNTSWVKRVIEPGNTRFPHFIQPEVIRLQGRDVLAFVRELRQESDLASTPYGQGYKTALAEVEEFILDGMWEEGDEPNDDDPEH